MFDVLVALVNDTPDDVRYFLMSAMPEFFDWLRTFAAEHGCTLFEDGSVGCR